MAIKICALLVALVCGGICNPLGQTTVCDSQNILPGLLPGLQNVATTVCDSTPNLLGLGYGLGLNFPVPYLPPYLNTLGSTTVCDSTPNLGLNTMTPIPINQGAGSTTVCESANSGLGLGGLGGGLPGLGGLGGLNGLNGLGLLGGLGGLSGLGGLGGLGGLSGLAGLGGISPLIPSSTTLIESAPNVGLGLGYGLPILPNLSGQTTLCESNQNLGVGYPLGLQRLGLGLPGLGLQGLGVGLPYGRMPINPLLLSGLPIGALTSVGVL